MLETASVVQAGARVSADEDRSRVLSVARFRAPPAGRLTGHAQGGGRKRLQPFRGDLLPAAVAAAVGAFGELGERPVDPDRGRLKLFGGDGALHLHHCVTRVVTGTLAELHLHAGGVDRLGQLGHLPGELSPPGKELGGDLLVRRRHLDSVRSDHNERTGL